MKPVKVAQFGLGSIGLEALRHAAVQPWIEVVGAVDNDPAICHRSLVELTGLGSLDGLRICPTLEELFREAQPDVILHAAAARAKVALQHLRPALECGLAVVSTCGELIFPALQSPAFARELEVLCQHAKARLVATGSHSGFVMDLLPICLSGVCRHVDHIAVERVEDAARRRRSEQAGIGCGQPPDSVRAKLESPEGARTGLRESVALIMHAMGWRLDGITSAAEPLVADRQIQTLYYNVAPGQVCGLRQRAWGRQGGVERVALEVTTLLQASEPGDTFTLRGRPDLTVTARGGIAGDDATVAAMINLVPRLLAAPPGLHLASALSVPGWTGSAR